MRREADELALVTGRLEAESGGEAAIEQAEAVPIPASAEQFLVAAEQQFDAAGAPDPGAVGDAVAVSRRPYG